MMMRALAGQTRVEVRLTLRRGENLFVTLLIPAALLLAFAGHEHPPSGYTRTVDFLFPGVLALAIMSTGLVSLSIATAYERFYHVLKRLGVTPLSRLDLVVAKVGAVLIVETIQVLALTVLAVAFLGWRPPATAWAALPLLALGTACFAGLGLLMAGALRAEAVLGLANTLFLAFVALGGLVAPLDGLPSWLVVLLRLLPAAALGGALRAVLAAGSAPAIADLAVLAVWAFAAVYLCTHIFHWE